MKNWGRDPDEESLFFQAKVIAGKGFKLRKKEVNEKSIHSLPFSAYV